MRERLGNAIDERFAADEAVIGQHVRTGSKMFAAADADSGFAIGDEVVVYPAGGAFAEYLVAPSSHVYRRPAGLGVEQAAGLLLAGVTAADILATLAVSSDDVLLVHSGGSQHGPTANVLTPQCMTEVWGVQCFAAQTPDGMQQYLFAAG